MMVEEVLDFSNLSDSEFVEQNGFLNAERAYSVLERLNQLENAIESIEEVMHERPCSSEDDFLERIESWIEELETVFCQVT